MLEKLKIKILPNNSMKKLFIALSVCAVISFTGCIDREFELTEVSGEITVGGEELTVPLADINNIYLGDLLKDNDMITNDDNGVYRISFSSFGDDPTKYESIAIDGIEIPAIKDLSPKLDPVSFEMAQLPESLVLDDIKEGFSIDFPTLGQAVKVDPISIRQELSLNLPSGLSGKGELTDEMLNYVPSLKNGGIKSSFNGSTGFKAEISILKELEKIDYVEFGDDSTPGALFSVGVNLNDGIKNINGGGTIKLYMEFPEGYHFLTEDLQPLPTIKRDGKDIPVLSHEVNIQKGESMINLVLYLQRIDYSHHSFNDGFLHIDDPISYSCELDIALCSGKFDLNIAPELEITATPIYKDIEVVINHFEFAPATYDVKYEFDNLPKEIDINTIAFTDDSSVTLKLSGLEWLKIRDNKDKESTETFSPFLEVKFPPCMHFSRAELANPSAISNLKSSDLHLGGDKVEDRDKNYILTASAEALASGIKLYIDHIDGKDSSIKREENALVIDTTIEATIHMESLDGHTILASAIIPPQSPLNIEFSMSNMKFTIDKERTDVAINEMVLDLNLSDQLPSLSQEVEIPEMISSIESISIGKANGNGAPVAIDFSLGTLKGSSFPVDEIDLDVAINLGNLLRPTEATKESGIITVNDKGESILTLKQCWKPNVAPLSAHIEFDALQNIPAIVNGKLKLDQAISIERCKASIKDGQKVDLTAISNAAIDMQISIDDIEVREFRGGFNLSVAPEDMVVELGDLSSLGVNINELSLNPVLSLNLKDNPTGIPFFANVALKTFDAEGKQLSEIVVPEIEIAGSGASNIVISTPHNAGKFDNVQFVEVSNLSQLLSNGIPAKIAVTMSVATDKSGIYTIDLSKAKEGYKLEYQYEVVVPLEFDGGVDISYKSKVTDLNETFAGLANDIEGLKVGDVSLVAELGTTIPFDIKLDAKLINADGTTDNIDATLNIGNNGIIEGWREEDGSNPHTTTLDIEFHLGDSHSLKALESVDGIEFAFTLTKPNTNEAVAIKDTQYLNGKLKLRVRNGLTIDIFDFLKGEGE